MLIDVNQRDRDALLRTGVAYILEVGEPPFTGYWESEKGNEMVIVESGKWDSYEDALKWGLKRAEVVVVTTEDGRTRLYHYD